MNRRSFIKTGAAASALTFPMILPSRVLGRDGKPGANERLVFGMIGVGNMGSGHVQNFSSRGSIAAIADAYLPHAEKNAKWLRDNNRVGKGNSVEVMQDYRKLLERDDIDAVIIASPHHWHALHSIHAAQAGKDIYCEKPMTYSVWEGRQVVKAIKKHKIVFQTGSQQRSSHVSHLGLTHVRNGTIGKIRRVLASNYPSPQENGFPGMPIHEGLDWDLWCGPAQKPDFNHAIWSNAGNVQPCWSGIRLFSGGDMSDWGAHGLDMIQWGLGMDESGPEEVWVEGEPFKSMLSTPENPGGRRGGPNSPKVFMKYPGGVILEFEGGHLSGGTFIGEKGQISVTRRAVRADPHELTKKPLGNPADEIYRGYEYARRTSHGDDWINAIKERRDPVASVETGHRTATVCHLGNIARWVSGITGETGQKLKWDAAAERFTNSEVANRFVRIPSRKGFEIPQV